MSSDIAPRQHSLVPLPNGSLQGWMDEDAAAAAGQLFGDGPSGLLVLDARELLTSTARVVGARLGELHFKAWMALVSLHVVHGMPEDGKASSTIGELSRLIWGQQERGGSHTRRILRTLFDLKRAEFTVPGYDLVAQRPASGVSVTSLLINLYVDEAILAAYGAEPGVEMDRAEFGKQLGSKGRGTVSWRLHPDYTQRLAQAELRRFDWTKAQRLRGSALTMWLLFTSPRVPFRSLHGTNGKEEIVEVPLTVDHCNALGVCAGTDAARRRTINEAGPRVCAADSSFVAFEAHGGRGTDSFLRVIRTTMRDHDVLERPAAGGGQLTLAAG